jgi:hypothetical protein
LPQDPDQILQWTLSWQCGDQRSVTCHTCEGHTNRFAVPCTLSVVLQSMCLCLPWSLLLLSSFVSR